MPNNEAMFSTKLPTKTCERSVHMITGLHVTMRGEELSARLEARIHVHRQRAERWRREQARTPEQQTDEEPLLPDEMCENEAERHEWRAEVLEFVRTHIESEEVYRLAPEDLVFAELLPEKPGWLEQQEYEERTNVGFQLERLSKVIGSAGIGWSAMAEER